MDVRLIDVLLTKEFNGFEECIPFERTDVIKLLDSGIIPKLWTFRAIGFS